MVAVPENFAQTVLDLAAEVERDERLVKEAILAATRQGDTATVAQIVELWLARPPGEVLAQTSQKMGRAI